jgi:hypothetical protein
MTGAFVAKERIVNGENVRLCVGVRERSRYPQWKVKRVQIRRASLAFLQMNGAPHLR